MTDAFHRLGIARAGHARGDVLQLTRLAGLGRARRGLAREVLHRTRAEDLERLRRAVLTRRVRQAVAIGEHTAIALVSDDGRTRAEYVSVTEPGPVEHPMTGAVHCVPAETVRHV